MAQPAARYRLTDHNEQGELAMARAYRPYLVILNPGTPQSLIVWTANATGHPSPREIRDAQKKADTRSRLVAE